MAQIFFTTILAAFLSFPGTDFISDLRPASAFWLHPCCDQSKTHRIHVWYICIYIWLIVMVNVGKYTIHGSYGNQPFPPLSYVVDSSEIRQSPVDTAGSLSLHLRWVFHIPCFFRFSEASTATGHQHFGNISGFTGREIWSVKHWALGSWEIQLQWSDN